MPSEKYTEEYLSNQLKHKIKEQLRQDDLDPTRLPSYEYLNSNGFKTRGLAKAIQRHFDPDMTLDDFLRQQGFGYSDGDWPTDHAETIKHLNGFTNSRVERNEDRKATVATCESALRVILRIAQDLHGTDNLFTFARYENDQQRYQANEQMEAIIDNLKDHKSDGAAKTYMRYLKEFYEYARIRTRIDGNPIKEVIGQYDFDTTPDSEPEPLDDDQIRALWQTAKGLPTYQDLTKSVRNLASRHGLRHWQIMVMALLLFGVAVGPRSKEYERTNSKDEWHLEDDPYIEFPKRKNLPGEVPVLAHPGFLDAYREYMRKINEDWNGKPFPNPENESGSRCKNTLNNWLAALCDEAGVRLDDGSYPTLQNLRQTWKNEYLEVQRINDVRLRLVAEEAGTKDPRHIKESYRSKEEERKSIRDLVTKDFEELLQLSELPEKMGRVIDQEEYMDRQRSLQEF